MIGPNTTVPGAVMVIAKTPQAGRSKTRLSPPLTPDQCAEVAWACLLDTLEAVAAVPAKRHVIVLDGEPGPWIPPGFEVIAQRGHGLAARLVAAFADVADTAIIVAMDTPQVTTHALTTALASLQDAEAAFGPAEDGGYWLIGLQKQPWISPHDVFDGVPMSEADTGAAQLARLASLGLSIEMCPSLRDVDVIDDLWAVADEVPNRRVSLLADDLRHPAR
jgi:uncharacterized protein